MLDGRFGLSLAKSAKSGPFPKQLSSHNSTMGASTEHEAASPSIAASQEQSVRQRENTTNLR